MAVRYRHRDTLLQAHRGSAVMVRLRIWLSRLAEVFRRNRLDTELREELTAHVDEATAEYVSRGVSPGEARRLALRDLGGWTRTEELHREARTWHGLEGIARDIRYGARSLRRSPIFAASTFFTIVICVCVTVTTFSLLHHIVLAPLPFQRSDRLIDIRHHAPGLGLNDAGMSTGLYHHYQDHATTISSLGLYETRSASLATDAGAERVVVTSANASLFRTLGAAPLHGRLFTEADGARGFMDGRWEIPVLLSHDLWLTRFGGRLDILDTTIVLGGLKRKVVGVMPQAFRFPDVRTQVWRMFESDKQQAVFSPDLSYSSVARLRDGVSVDEAAAELSMLATSIVGRFRDVTPERVSEARVTPVVRSLKSSTIGTVAHALWPLFGGMLLLTVFACLNVSGLMVVRTQERERELSVRLALGAGDADISRLLFVEAFLATMPAACAGFALAFVTIPVVMAGLPLVLPRAAEVQVDGLSVGFAFVLGLAITMVCTGVAIQQHGRARSALHGQWSTGSTHSRHARSVLIALQTALAVTLLAGAALMAQTHRNLSRVDLGFAPDNVLTMEVSLPGRKSERHTEIMTRLVETTRGLPQVIEASAVSTAPLTPDGLLFHVRPNEPPVAFRFFVPGYFNALGIPLVEGTMVGPGARNSGNNPVLVSAALARRLSPEVSPVGRPLHRLDGDGQPSARWNPAVGRIVPMPPFTIAGVVGDVRDGSLRDGPRDIVYVPVIAPRVEQSVVPIDMTLVVRTGSDPLALVAAIRQQIATVDPDLAIGRVETLASIVDRAHGVETLLGTLLTVAAVTAGLLGLIAVYGTVAHVARLRSRELGIRAALGAAPARLTSGVAAEAIRPSVLGVLIGALLALAASQTLASLLFGVSPHDAVTMTLVPSAVFIAAVATAWVAARRTAHADPLTVLRGE